ncbi:hypothetical protein Adt_19014 [Abeliophyllum distichum]|uniref:Uncharacterized protein n=1 Tax=Abeliophyllum distichum TaxID=126358 RepID=A0ABD1TL62_9LAMI
MENPHRTDPNAPDRPPKPSDIPLNMTGQPPTSFPSPHTRLTPLESGLTPQHSLPCAATLGLNPSEAATFSTGCASVGPPPVGSPSAVGQFEESFDGQRLAPAILETSHTRGSLHTHVSTYGSYSVFPSHAPNCTELSPALDVQSDAAHPPPSSIAARTAGPATSGLQAAPSLAQFSDAPTRATTTSTHLLDPRIEEFPIPAADTRPSMPGPQALQSAPTQQSNLGVSGSDGLPLNQTLEPIEAPNPIAAVAKDATLPAPSAPSACACGTPAGPAASPSSYFFRPSPFAYFYSSYCSGPSCILPRSSACTK